MPGDSEAHEPPDRLLDAQVQFVRAELTGSGSPRSSRVTLTTSSKLMNVSQARVSKIERGDLSHSELGTLQAYVAALGGKLNVIADFGDQEITVE